MSPELPQNLREKERKKPVLSGKERLGLSKGGKRWHQSVKTGRGVRTSPPGGKKKREHREQTDHKRKVGKRGGVHPICKGEKKDRRKKETNLKKLGKRQRVAEPKSTKNGTRRGEGGRWGRGGGDPKNANPHQNARS